MTKKISDFTPQKRNANKHTPYGLRLLEKSLREDGFIDAQTAAADGEIISGSARLEKAVEVFTDEDGQEVEPIIVHSDGKRPVIVIRDDIPNAEHPRARRLSVAANKIAQVDFDPDWALLKEWGGEDEQIKKLFSDDEWREGTGEEKPQVDAEPQIDRAAELQEKWQTASGQLWQLGKHRLLIGDCTVRENVERLMGGERADMVFNDPPYGMRLDTDYSGIMDRGKKYEAVIGDDSDWDYSRTDFFDCQEQFYWGADYYRNTLPTGGSWFVWDKQISDHDGLSHTGSLFELCWSKAEHKREIIKAPYFRFYGMDTKTRLHPTQKPEKLYSWFIDKFSKESMIIVDLFAGSGTTIIAAHNLNRRCYAMEISEKYGAVILERFYTATGITPELVTE